MVQRHYPFPQQNLGINIDEIIIPYGRLLTEQEELFHYRRRFSKEVALIKSQYLIIEKELISTFDYVYPIESNLHTASSKFGFIIKNACNLFELVCRRTYKDIYGVDNVNIYNYLSLDYFLHLNSLNVQCELLEGEFPKDDSNIQRPFLELNWDYTSEISHEMLPKWWTAYNHLKHNVTDFPEYATMENAIRATAAVAHVIYRIYGAGVVLGKMQWFEMVDDEKRYYCVDTEQSALFHVSDGRTYYTY